MAKLKAGSLLGRFFAASRNSLREVAAHLRVHHLANLGGCPAR
jgi:DNA-binding FadR family transcriptional regulator